MSKLNASENNDMDLGNHPKEDGPTTKTYSDTLFLVRVPCVLLFVTK